MKPAIAITVGDCNGIGPEVVLKCLLRPEITRICRPMLVGPAGVFLAAARSVLTVRELRSLFSQPLVVVESSSVDLRSVAPGKVSRAAGLHAAYAIKHAVRMALTGSVAAIVTAPVSKKALHLAGFNTAGQTELLQQLTSSRTAAMMLVSPFMRVSLATIHIPLRKVPRTLTLDLLNRHISTIHHSLQTDWRIAKPRLAVLGLNPHAGEDGDIGDEERRVIGPAVRTLRSRKMSIDGPFPADAFFGRYRRGSYDAIIAMYHDEALIPLKMSSQGKAVNVTAGLPIIRTSPDHGTAFDIAGKGVADPASMIEAIKLAVTLSKNRAAARQ
jgi:4-hydroxythreonine-4-phosphate dehydrogenase